MFEVFSEIATGVYFFKAIGNLSSTSILLEVAAEDLSELQELTVLARVSKPTPDITNPATSAILLGLSLLSSVRCGPVFS